MRGWTWLRVRLLPTLLLAVSAARGEAAPTNTTATAADGAAAGARVSGRVVDPKGNPLCGAVVVVDICTDFCGFERQPPRRLVTDEQGSYSFYGPATSVCVSVQATLPGHRCVRGGGVVAWEELRQSKTLGDIVLLPLPATVTGRVFTEDGKPCAGAIVFAQGKVWDVPAVSDADGWFMLRNLPEGGVLLVALHGRRAVCEAECKSSDAQVAIRLRAPPADTNTAAPTGAEKALALKILREAWEYSRNHEYYARSWLLAEMSLLDKPLATKLLDELQGGGRKDALTAIEVAPGRAVSATNGVARSERAASPGGPVGEVERLLAKIGEDGDQTRISGDAFTMAGCDPNRARLLIETGLSNPGCDVRGAALAMCAIDVERAVEIARTLKQTGQARDGEWYCDTLRKISQWLTAARDIRATLRFDRWNASDTWTPGEPTGW